MTTRDAMRKRGELHDQNKALLDRASRERRNLTESEQRVFDGRDQEIDELRKTIDREARHAALDVELRTSMGRQTETSVSISPLQGTREDLAFRAWCLGNRASTSMVEAAESVGLRYMVPELETRALSIGTTTAGGNSVPNEMMRGYREAEKWFGRVANLATVFNTTTGAPLPIPTSDDTANTGEIIGEASAVTTTADPSFGQLVLHPFKYSSKAVIVSVELLQDSMIPLPEYLGRKLGERIGRIQNTHFTVGAGTTLPFGVAVQASLGKTAAATNAITFDEIIDLFHSVDVAYRDKPKTRFMMNDATAQMLRKVKDSQNRYLWEMSLVAGQPDRIFGKDIEINNDMDSPTATAKRVVLFGDFSAYVIQNAGDVTFIRADELRVLNHQVVFLAYQRADGALADTTAIRYLRTA